jgi:hypothetical protein
MEYTNVKDALNKANLAIRKYFSIANEVSVGTAESVLTGPRDDAIKAIMEFANAKRAIGEKTLTPYEEHCLGVMDAANEIAIYKTHPTNIKDYKYNYEGGCTCGQCETQ